MPLQFESPQGDPSLWLAIVEEEIARLVTREIRSIARDAADLYWDSLTAAGDLGVFDIVPIRWNSFVDGQLVDTFGGVYTNGSVSTFLQAPGSAALPIQTAFEWAAVVNTDAVAYARTMPNRMRDVGDHLWNDLTTKISAGIESGDVRDRLRTVIQETGEFSAKRAEMIARTETTRAYNAGTLAGAQALGEFGPTEKVWSSGMDERVRETHAAADNQYVGINEQFQVGDALMDAPGGDGPAEEVVNCRCTLLFLYPGDTRPDGTTVPEATAPEAPALGIELQDFAPSAYGPGPASVQKFSRVLEIPQQAKGRVKVRAEAMADTVAALDRIHGMTNVLPRINLVLGGKSTAKGGHFTPGTRGPKPKRVRGESFQDRSDKVKEYNSRPLQAEIRINDFDIDKQMFDLTHELGHAVDWDGTTFASRRAWSSAEARSLQSKYKAEWLDHLDEIQDTETRLFLQLGKEVREAESVRGYISNAPVAYRQYFTSVEEVWARSYSQWAAEVTGESRLVSAVNIAKAKGYQFADDEFARIKPIIEGILKERGLLQ
jgi:hypothetical protein